ncbi:MAG: DUF423 domain-containing protein [Planctomycetota bacterium]|nr:DUF423 domain-containing protein [Planctomycetota bacterium]
MDRHFFVMGAALAFLGVAAGAFGAHGLKSYFAARYDPDLAAKMLAAWETGARYQLYHALALLAVAWACTRWPGGSAAAAGWCFVGGTVVFSGSLYVLCLTGHTWLGAVTPLGGAAYLVGWLCLLWAAWKGGA